MKDETRSITSDHDVRLAIAKSATYRRSVSCNLRIRNERKH